MIERRSREQITKDMSKVREKYLEPYWKISRKKPTGQKVLDHPYKSVQMALHYTPPEILQERQDKIEEIKRTMTEKSTQKPIVQLNQLQMLIEDGHLLQFYMWGLFANNMELSFPEIVKKVNQKFRDLINEKDVAGFLLQSKENFGEDSFFEYSHTNFKDRLNHFLKYSLRKKMISFMNYLNYIKKNEYRERIRDIELKSLMDPKLSYRPIENSPFWSFYQLDLDNGILPTKLITFFPDKGSISQYAV